MALFALRRAATGDPGVSDLSARQRLGLPHRFEALAEALASGSNSDVCAEVARHLGAALAQDGVSLAEALAQLRMTSLSVLSRDPAYDVVTALSTGWSEAMLGYLHGLSCEDPLTGLSSLAHVRARLSELYRGELRRQVSPTDRYALVVVELGPEPGVGGVAHQLRLARVANAARTVFPGEETIGRVTDRRIAVVVGRDDRLGRRLGLLRTLLGQDDLADGGLRIWVESLPPTEAHIGAVLDELTRR